MPVSAVQLLRHALIGAFLALSSRPLPKRSERELGLLGLLDPVQAAGWRVRVLGVRRDAVFSQDIELQKRHRTVFLPDPDLLPEDEFLALCLHRLARVGFAVPESDVLSAARFRANARLRNAVSRPV